MFLELARYPKKMQSRLRSGIRETEAAIRTRGGTQLTVACDALHDGSDQGA